MSRYRIIRDDGCSEAIAGQVFDFYDAAHALPERYDADLCCSDDRQLSGSKTRVTRALVQRRIIQVSQDRSGLVIRGDLVFLQQRSVVRVLGTNGKGMAGTLRLIEEESAGLDGTEGRHWSQRGIARLARKAWVKAVADVAEDCFAVQRKVLESHEARVRQEARQQKLIHRLELLQARYEGNRLLY